MGATRSTKPLTAHPAFPAIVALWFAALLGLGTFVVPPANFEGLVVGTGLATLVPAAAPPLGDTARIAISAIAALLGALLGLAIAARIRKVEDEPQASGEAADPAADSPWLADDDTPSQNLGGFAATSETALHDRAADKAPGTVPNRLARRRSTMKRDEPLPDVQVEEEAERIFQASEVSLEDADAAAPEPKREFEALAEGEASPDAEQPVEEDDDLQRFAADRLVAGLPRVQRRNFDDDPLEDWSRADPVETETDRETGFADAPAPAVPEPAESEHDGPDFDGPQPIDAPEYEAEYEPLPVEPLEPEPRIEDEFDPEESDGAPGEAVEWAPAASEAPVETSWTREAVNKDEDEHGPEPTPLDIAGTPLADLVARFDAALAAQRSRSPRARVEAEETQPQTPPAEQADDPVIAFLRREADRDRGTPGDSRRERADDPRAVLRSALDKLDRVSRKS